MFSALGLESHRAVGSSGGRAARWAASRGAAWKGRGKQPGRSAPPGEAGTYLPSSCQCLPPPSWGCWRPSSRLGTERRGDHLSQNSRLVIQAPVGWAPGRAMCLPMAGTWFGLCCRRAPLPGRVQGHGTWGWGCPSSPHPSGPSTGAARGGSGCCLPRAGTAAEAGITYP